MTTNPVSSVQTAHLPASGGGETAGADWKWVGTWAAAPQAPDPFLAAAAPPTFVNQTLRQVVRVSLGGNEVRVRLSNAFGLQKLMVGAAHVGLRASDACIQPGSGRALTFGGRPAVAVPAGAVVLSDSVNLEVADLSELAVSLFLPERTVGQTVHADGRQTHYLCEGNQTDRIEPTDPRSAPTLDFASTPLLASYFLSGVEVLAPQSARVITVLGDSITDGYASTINANCRWPDHLARRFSQQPRPSPVSVLNVGIGGNRLLHDGLGSNALARFDRDVLSQAGVTDLIILEGINDLGFGTTSSPEQAVSAEDLVGAYRQLIVRAHAAGLKVYGGTLTPFAGIDFLPGFSNAANEVKRQAVNAFIRNGGEFDGVIDFEAALRDGDDPPRLLGRYDCGDRLHPNDAGYAAMADAVDLNFFQRGF